jgi:hypothetical protein
MDMEHFSLNSCPNRKPHWVTMFKPSTCIFLPYSTKCLIYLPIYIVPTYTRYPLYPRSLNPSFTCNPWTRLINQVVLNVGWLIENCPNYQPLSCSGCEITHLLIMGINNIWEKPTWPKILEIFYA